MKLKKKQLSQLDLLTLAGSSYAPTSNVMPVGKVAENFSEQLQQQQQQQQKQSSVPAINSHQNSTVKAAHLDTTNGVRTSDLYESGHFEANSDLCGPDAGEKIRT